MTIPTPAVALLVSSALAGARRTEVCPDSPERASKWIALALAAAGGFMTTLDASIVNISLPSIARSFGVPLSGTVEWVITAYLVAIAAVQLTLGRLADMVGRKPIFVAGLTVFTLASAACGAAPSLGLLLAARAVQGLGAALIFAVNLAMITHAFPEHQRGRALGINAILVALGVSVGPTVGGLLTDQLSWRWIFYVNVPVGALVALAAIKLLHERRHHARQRFDPAGAALLALAMGSLTLGLSFGHEWGWTSPRLILTVSVGAAALLALLLVERRVSAPVLDPALLRNRTFLLANTSYVLAMLALFAVSFLLPFYFEQLRGFSTQRSGLLLTPLSLTLAIVAPISGSLADRLGSRWLAALGLAIACLGLVMLSRLTATSSMGHVVASLVVTGLGQGMFLSPNTRAIMTSVPAAEQGLASGVFATGRVVGQSLSVALSGAVFSSLGGAAAGTLLAARPRHLPPEQLGALGQTFVHALETAFLVCAAIAAVGVVTALLAREHRTEEVTAPGRRALSPQETGA